MQEPLELRPGQRLHDDVPVQDGLVQALRVDLEHRARAGTVDVPGRVQSCIGALRAAALEPVRELGKRRRVRGDIKDWAINRLVWAQRFGEDRPEAVRVPNLLVLALSAQRAGVLEFSFSRLAACKTLARRISQNASPTSL